MPDATLADLLGSNILLHYDASDAGSLFSDTGGTTPASDGDSVLCWKPQSAASLTVNVTHTTGPTYRANYSTTGYPALEFNGSTQRLFNSSPGLGTLTRFFVLCAFHRTTTASVTAAVSFGNSASHYIRLGGSSAVNNRWQAVGGSALTLDVPFDNVRAVAACCIGSGQNKIDLIGACAGNTTASVISGSLTDYFTLGSRGDVSQFWPGGLMEVIVIESAAEWGQVIRASKLLRTKWGISDPNPTPQIANSGGVRSVNIRGGADQ